MTKFAIARPINGVTINGNEYVLNENNEVMTFDTKKEAQDFLLENGITRDELPSLDIVEYE